MPKRCRSESGMSRRLKLIIAYNGVPFAGWQSQSHRYGIQASLQLELLKKAANRFVGTHDFAAFAASRGEPEKSTTRTIYSAAVRRSGSCLMIDFDGDGFLYKMIRLIIGSVVRCALGKSRIEEV